MDWRREDSVHAGATVAAAAVIAYLLAANFGLVPSPFASADSPAGIPLTIPRVFETAAPTDEPVGLVPPPPPELGTQPALTAAATDAVPPVAAITTEDGVALSTLTDGATVDGTADDAGSGIRKVAVTFEDSGGVRRKTDARLDCRASRTRCIWSADVPGAVGSYRVSATATDRVGNSSAARPINITAVNPGRPVEEASDDGVVADVLDFLSDLLP